MSGNSSRPLRAAIVDYGLGNLFSIRQACAYAGMEGRITSSAAELEAADVVILPGVGAFGDAMAQLHRLDLVSPLRALAQADRPLVGICLGLQLFMSESHEFGRHEGLGLIPGSVIRFEAPREGDRILKVPQVGWNRIFRPEAAGGAADPWAGTPLEGQADGEHMYFVHSFYAVPESPDGVLSRTRYGHIEFCSSVRRGNLFACQFHPERSGRAGLQVYRRIASAVSGNRQQGA